MNKRIVDISQTWIELEALRDYFKSRNLNLMDGVFIAQHFVLEETAVRAKTIVVK